MINTIIIFLLLLSTPNKKAVDDPSLGSDYRAAVYSSIIDFRDFQKILPGTPLDITTYIYYIQYSKDKVIVITDPGIEIEYFPITIVTWDYAKGMFAGEFILNHVRKYYIQHDSITFSIDESRGVANNLCNNEFGRIHCDSVSFLPGGSDIEYLLFFNDTTSNLSSHELFYPDIKYLPSKIIRKAGRNNTKILEDVFYGKSKVDSLISLFSHEGYEQITEEEMGYLRRQFLMEEIERLMPERKD